MKKTGGVIATILTSLLCGLPGLGLAGFGLLGLLGTGTTVQSSKNLQNAVIGAAIFIGGGIILIIIPIVVGLLSLRNKRTPALAYAAPIPQTYAAPAQPAYTLPPAQPFQVTSQPVPQPGAAPIFNPTQDLYARLMALNRPTAPYRIVDGRSENVDLIAEWKIVDAQWYQIFAKANLTKVFRIFLKFDPTRRDDCADRQLCSPPGP